MSATTEEYKGHFIAGKVPAYRLGSNGQAVVEVNGIDKELGRYGSSESRHRYLRILAKFQTNGFNQEMVPKAIANYRRLKARKERERVEREEQLRLRKERQERDRLERLERKAAEEIRREQRRVEMEERRKKRESRQQRLSQTVEDWIVDATLPNLGQVMRDMVCLQRLLGCETAELCEITPADVEETMSGYCVSLRRKSQGKTRIREVELSKEAYEIISKYLDRPAYNFCFSPEDSVARMREERHRNRKRKRVQAGRAKENSMRVPGHKYDTDKYVYRILVAARKTFPVPDRLTQEQVNEWIKKYHWHPKQLAKKDGIQNERRERAV